VIEAAPDAIIAVDQDGRVDLWNPAAERLFGWSEDEVLGEPNPTVPESKADEFDRIREQTLAGEPVTGLDTRRRTRSGEEIDVSVSAGPVRDEGGDVVGGVAVIEDISDRKQRERDLERYRSIVESAEDGMYVLDGEGRFRFVNRRVVEASGIPRERWIGAEMEATVEMGILDPDEAEEMRAAIEAIAAGERDEMRTELQPDAPADIDYLELRLMPFEGRDRVIGFSRDVTEEKQTELVLRRRNERLDEFASIVSHDLRNPLNVATARLELAREECDSDHLSGIADAHDRMERLIEDLRALSRGDDVGDVQPVALGDAARRCWDDLGASTATLAADTAATVRADPDQLRRLLENLLRNAIEHAGPDVEITVGDTDDGFYVADDGPGIPEDERDRIFEPGHSTSDDGTGFGLRIVDRIADAHGWDARVTDSETGGARFEIAGIDRAAA
jgi:PAS domain S-box-containing protein